MEHLSNDHEDHPNQHKNSHKLCDETGHPIVNLMESQNYPKSKFKFNVVSEETVLKLLQDLDENKAVDLDNLSGKFLKDGATVLAKPISQICNLSIKYSIFPSDCKIAKLKPLFKKGSETDPKSYHPISLLSLVSKIIEKVISDRTQRFLDKNYVIYKYESGFRKFFSTDSCLSYLNNK